jgi:tetratricopeptide (TPR) repeat protein
MSMTATGAASGDTLADVRPFRLGGLRLEPALLCAWDGDRRLPLEPRIARVLVALHEAGGAVVSRDALISRCWGGRAVTDDSLQRCVAALRRLAATLDPPAFVIETIPRVGYRMLADEGGAAVPAPVVKAPERVEAPDWSVGKGGPPRALVAAAAALGLCGILAAAAAPRFMTPPPRLVAVNAFDAGSSDPITAGVARTLPATLAADLSRLGVPVRGPTPGPAPRDAAYVVDGVISGPGAVVVRIADPRSGQILWSRSFTSGAGERDALGPEISAAVGSAFTGPVRLFGDDAARGGDLAAKLRVVGALRDGDGLAALAEADRLARRSPRDPAALALFAESVGAALPEVPTAQRSDLWRRGREAADRAGRLAPASGEVYIARSAMTPPSDPAGRLAILELGARRAPDSPAIQAALGQTLNAVGRNREAVQWRRRALAADPLSRAQTQALIVTAADVEGRASAYGLLASARERLPAPGFWAEVELHLAARFADAESFDRARAALGERLRQAPDYRRRLDAIGAALRRPSPATRSALAAECLDPARRGAGPVQLCAYALAALGERDAALDLLETFVADSFVGPSRAERDRRFLEAPWSVSKASVLFRTPFQPLWREPRMWSLFARLGLVDYWRRSGRWPDFCDGREPGLDCRAAAEAAVPV